MTDDDPFPHGKAAALVAYALDVDAPDTVRPEVLTALVDQVCDDDTERTRLVALLAASQSKTLPSVVLELLLTRLDRMKTALEIAEDQDEVFGVWSQRIAGGALLAGIGFVAAQLVTGGWAALAVLASAMAGVATSLGRSELKRRARRARRRVEQTQRMIDTVNRDF